jgi:hypothetical protein
MVRRNRREYGLSQADRDQEIVRKLGPLPLAQVHAMLANVADPTDQVLGAIVFLMTRFDELPGLVSLANDDREQLLITATVKDERG